MVNAPYTKDYVREMDRRNKERIIDHNKRNKNSYILKHSRKDHSYVWELGFQVLGNNYRSPYKQKITVVKIY